MTMNAPAPVLSGCKDFITRFSAVGLVCASAGFGAAYAWGTGVTQGVPLACLAVLAAVALDAAKPFAVSGMIEAARSWDVPRSLGLAALAGVAILFSLTAELQLMCGRGPMLLRIVPAKARP